MTQEDVKKEKKLRDLRIIRASNEMLNMAKESIMKQTKLTDLEKQEKISQIDGAIDENYQKGKYNLGTDRKTIDSINYVAVSEEQKKKYKEYLEKKGLTDEQLHQKDMATAGDVATIGNDEGTTSIKKRRRRSKEKEDKTMGIERVSNEEELMKKSMVSSDDELDKLLRKKKSEKPTNKIKETLTKAKENEKVKDKETDEKVVTDIKQEVKKSEESENVTYDFDFSSIPDYVQYDVIPLPSNGECYPHHISRVPVAYLTAADENIIASPNMYRDGKIIDVILERKILDKRIKVSELCQGDRDAIILWLRATGYGNDFPIVATHPDSGKKYNLTVDLSTLKYLDFKLKGDENGLFEYKTEKGDILKFKCLSKDEEDNVKEAIVSKRINNNIIDAVKFTAKLQECVNEIDSFNEEDKTDINDCIADIKDILVENKVESENVTREDITEVITLQMKAYTVSVNGNSDKEFVSKYIDNMRSKEAYAYRIFVNQNKPGINFIIKVNVPESDGGGSFNTFLTFDNTIFINI